MEKAADREVAQKSKLYINLDWFNKINVYVDNIGALKEKIRLNVNNNEKLTNWIDQCDMIMYDEGSLLTSIRFDSRSYYSYIRAILNDDFEILSDPDKLCLTLFYNAYMVGASLRCKYVNGDTFTLGIISKLKYSQLNSTLQ